MDKMKFQEVVDFINKQDNVSMKVIDTNTSIENQGHFDLMLYKLTDLLVQENKEDSKKVIQLFEEYFKIHPRVIQIDPVSDQRKVLHRGVISEILLTVETELPKELKIRAPRYLIFEKEEPIYDTSKFSFPVVCKTTQACGSVASHQMGVVFNEKGIHSFTPPILVQEYYNHNSTIFKVFVIGDHSVVVKRKSLPNLNADHMEPIFFDSQQPLKEQLGKFSSSNEEEETKLLNDAIEPPTETIRQLSASLNKNLGLNLFGYDVITQLETGHHGVIDVNYFPGYVGVKDFSQVLLDFLVQKVRSSKQ